MRYPPVVDKTAMITGCSSGIGAATARYLRDRGWTVIPTARKADDLEALAADGFQPVELDVADTASVQRAVREANDRLNGRIGALVNNAGFAQAGALEDVTRESLRYQFEVNVFGMQELTNLVVPQMRAQGNGRIVNISSIFGLITSPMLGSYCATKYAMESLSDALRLELRSSGIAVVLVEPGPIISAFRKNAATQAEKSLDVGQSRYGSLYAHQIERRKNRKREKRPDLFNRPPEDVAKRILHALESPRPKRRYRVTIPAHFGAFMRRAAPTALLDYLLWRRIPKPDEPTC